MAKEYDERRRHDPEINAKVRRVVEAQKKAMREAERLVSEAARVLNSVADYPASRIYADQVKRINSAWVRLESDTRFEERPITDTYISNLSFDSLGAQIEDEGDEFRL